ncbi:MAG: T9SS type A sorting domain-containing protein [Thermaurantimonas sp.]|uniref:T9SS type A sorting domain-containing protein n=1 Tax=Thermaurantimonas sp. TaxID=2681568 RepID=UPI0039195239
MRGKKVHLIFSALLAYLCLLSEVKGQFDSSFIRSFNMGFGFHSGGPISVGEDKDKNLLFTFGFKTVGGGIYGEFPYFVLYDQEGFLLNFFAIPVQQYFTSLLLRDSRAWIVHTFRDGRILLRHFSGNDLRTIAGWIMLGPNYQMQWVNDLHLVPMYVTDTLALGLSITGSQNALEVYCINLINGMPMWSYPIPDSLRSETVNVNGVNLSYYRFSQIYNSNGKTHLVLHKRQNSCEKIQFTFTLEGYDGFKVEEDCYEVKWVSDKIPLEVKRYNLYSIPNPLDNNRFMYDFQSVLVITSTSGDTLLTFDKADLSAGYSFHPEKVWFEEDSTFTVFFIHSWDTIKYYYHGMLNFSLDGKINWCRDYKPLPLGSLISGNENTPIRLSDKGFLTLDFNKKYIIKIDNIGRIVKSDIGITITKNYCTYIHEPEPEISYQSPAIYPNPNDGIFYLHTNGQGYYQIIDLRGRIIFDKKVSESIENINIRHLASALYLLRYIADDHKVYSFKFVKK